MIRDCRRASVKGLEIVKRARKRQGWTKSAPIWAITAQISVATLKKFWTRANLMRDNFDRICQAVGVNPDEICESESDLILSTEMEIAVLDDEWVGRENLIESLITKLQDLHRLILLLGITGIGKTALAENLVIKLRGNWIELRENCENTTRPKDFVTVASSWLTSWGEKVSNDLKKNPEQLLNRLVDKLCNGKYLLLVDSLEYLLIGNETDGWGNFADPQWAMFWKSLLSAPTCQSRIIITSQDFPVQLERDCERYPNRWHLEKIAGLIASEQKKLFKKIDLLEDLENPDLRLMLIGEIYAGHPLALRVIGGEIKQSWQGNIAAYWQENSRYIEEVRDALTAAKAAEGSNDGTEDRWKLDSYTNQLRNRVRERINITFERLRSQLPIAHELICTASIYRGEVPEVFWLAQLEMEGYVREQQLLAITDLRNRFLIEDCGFDSINQRLVAQHNLIRSVAIAQRLKFYSDD
jgi:hypothetical protein